MHVANLADRQAFTTLDGSTIREICGPCAPAYRHEDTVLTGPNAGP